MSSTLDRHRGALVGVLAGDALGAPYETWPADKVKADLTKRGGLVGFDYPNPWPKELPKVCPMGRPTDDSDHTVALAESILSCRGFDEENLYYRLRDIVHGHRSPLWGANAFGAGKTTKKILKPRTWEASRALPKDGAIPSNGSLMRSVPLALYYGSPHRVQPNEIRKMSEVTHVHPQASECCVAFIYVLTTLLIGAHPRLGIEYAEHATQDPDIKKILADPEVVPRDPEVWPGRGAAVFTLHVALWSLMTATSFRHGITKVVALGGDTDTYGAVAGGLLGAKFGIDAIPKDWQDILIGRKKMDDLAAALYDLSYSS